MSLLYRDLRVRCNLTAPRWSNPQDHHHRHAAVFSTYRQSGLAFILFVADKIFIWMHENNTRPLSIHHRSLFNCCCWGYGSSIHDMMMMLVGGPSFGRRGINRINISEMYPFVGGQAAAAAGGDRLSLSIPPSFPMMTVSMAGRFFGEHHPQPYTWSETHTIHGMRPQQ